MTNGPVLNQERTRILEEMLASTFGMSVEDAHDVAGIVAEVFGDNEEVDDDTLDTEIRSIFYTLESRKILTFRRIEYTWETGETRRGYFWSVRLEQFEKHDPRLSFDEEDDIYGRLPTEVWSARTLA